MLHFSPFLLKTPQQNDIPTTAEFLAQKRERGAVGLGGFDQMTVEPGDKICLFPRIDEHQPPSNNRGFAELLLKHMPV
jgi:hypothetical protein